MFARQQGAPGYGHYPFSQWREGDVVRDPRSVSLVGQVPTGVARVVVVALFPNMAGPPLGQIDLGSVVVADRSRDFALPSPQHAANASFGGQIRLLGFDLSTDSIAVGSSVKLTLYWQAIANPAANYTVFTHLLDAGDLVVGQKDNPPQNGAYPTLGWAPNEVVKDDYELFLKGRPASAELTLEAGLYEPASGLRLKVEGTSEDRTVLAKVKVRA